MPPLSTKLAPEDFVVEELPAHAPTGEGQHLWLWIEKRGLSTGVAVGRLARALGVPRRRVRTAGLKDARALTRQWVSVDLPPPDAVARLAKDPDGEAWVRVLVRSAAIDVMRGRPEFRRGGGEREHGWFSLATLVTRDGMRAPDTLAAKQREVERFMSESVRAAKEAMAGRPSSAASSLAERWRIPVLHTRRLVKKVELYEPILQRVLAGQSYPEVASALELSRREVELVIGYIEELFHARGFAA